MAQTKRTKFNILPDDLYDLYVVNELSTVQIAKHYGLYFQDGKPNAPLVQRALDRYNIPQRSKSTAQRLALEKGTAVHPTEGTERPIETKLKIGQNVSKAFKELTPEQQMTRMEGVNEFWQDPNNKKRQKETRSKIGEALKQAIANGTHLEQAICSKLKESGYKVESHVKRIFGNSQLEADIVVTTNFGTIFLEIDGPRHYKCFIDNDVAKLAERIRTDYEKNGLVLQRPNTWMIRILYPYGKEILYVMSTLSKIKDIFEYIKSCKTKKVAPKDRLIILDMMQVMEQKSCIDNDEYRAAIKILKKTV